MVFDGFRPDRYDISGALVCLAGVGPDHVRAALGAVRMSWLIVGLGVTFAVYALAVLALVALGRRSDARALAGFIPDCLVFVKRLLGDPRVPRRYKLLLGALVGYLAMPVDLVPDFIPVAGQLDDAILVALVLRAVLRSGGEELLDELWGGPARSLEFVRRVTFGAAVG
jgi:uncharacterized membrane protein YkvA (DUF1232 family)